jgi:hypothetical protein
MTGSGSSSRDGRPPLRAVAERLRGKPFDDADVWRAAVAAMREIVMKAINWRRLLVAGRVLVRPARFHDLEFRPRDQAAVDLILVRELVEHAIMLVAPVLR